MTSKNGPCCGEHAQPIPTKGHPHAMHFVMLLAGMGLVYALAGVILLTKISNQQVATAPAKSSAVATTTTASVQIAPQPKTILTSVEIASPTIASVEVVE